MANSFNGGPTPNYGHLICCSINPTINTNNIAQCNYLDGEIGRYTFRSSVEDARYSNVVAIFRCKLKPAPPTEVFQADLDTDLNF